MLILEIVKNVRSEAKGFQRTALLVIMLVLLLLAAKAQAQTQTAYYSTGAPIIAAPLRACPAGVCASTGIDVNQAGIADLSLAATVYVPLTSSAKLRLQLSGTAPAGYRGGMLLANGGTLAGLKAVGAITLRTYLSTTDNPAPATPQESRVVDASAAQVQLAATNGQPMQLELTSTKDFNQVEIEFASVASLGTTVKVNYAYGIGANRAKAVLGYVSSLGNQAVVSGCDNINNPQNAADANLTNYATFASLATVNCPSQLKVKLDGRSPAGYSAGFVVGQGNNLLDAGVLNSGLVLRTYNANGDLLETSSSTALINLSLLPDGRSQVSFPTTQAFTYVSIERVGAVTALDNMQLYYGVGVASRTVTPTILSNFADGSSHYKVAQNGVACVSCGVDNPANAAGSNSNAPATINVPVGVANSIMLRVDLNGAGTAGNRAGMVIGRNSLLDAAALSRVTLTTYDDNGNVLETAAGSSLLTLNLLPDGRQTVSFNTTKNFSKVSITMSGVAGVVDTTSVYYGFADDSNGSLNLTTPAAPLPVSLTSFGVRRVAGSGAAAISWTTASETNSASFVVERSANPAAGFVAVGQVAAAGNSLTLHTYSLLDQGAATQAGILYYRLRQLDADGTAILSGVVVVAASLAKAEFSLYPNPAPATAQQVTLSSSTDLSAGYSVSLYSNMGQLLSSRTVRSEGNVQPLTISTSGLAAGIYHVVLRDAAGQQLTTQRLQVAGQ